MTLTFILGACTTAHGETTYYAIRYKVDSLSELRMSTAVYLKTNITQVQEIDDEAAPELSDSNAAARNLVHYVKSRDSGGIQAMTARECYEEADVRPVEATIKEFLGALSEYSEIVLFGFLELPNGAYALVDGTHSRGVSHFAAFPFFYEDSRALYCPKFGSSPAGQLIQSCLNSRYQLVPPHEAEASAKSRHAIAFPVLETSGDREDTNAPDLILPFADEQSDEYQSVSQFVTEAFEEMIRLAKVEDASERDLRAIAARYLSSGSIKMMPPWYFVDKEHVLTRTSEIERWKFPEILAVSPLGSADFLVFTRGYEEKSSFETLWAHVDGNERYVFNFRANDAICGFLRSAVFRETFEREYLGKKK